jgi:hypothetical protein
VEMIAQIADCEGNLLLMTGRSGSIKALTKTSIKEFLNRPVVDRPNKKDRPNRSICSLRHRSLIRLRSMTRRLLAHCGPSVGWR